MAAEITTLTVHAPEFEARLIVREGRIVAAERDPLGWMLGWTLPDVVDRCFAEGWAVAGPGVEELVDQYP